MSSSRAWRGEHEVLLDLIILGHAENLVVLESAKENAKWQVHGIDNSHDKGQPLRHEFIASCMTKTWRTMHVAEDLHTLRALLELAHDVRLLREVRDDAGAEVVVLDAVVDEPVGGCGSCCCRRRG